MAQGDQPTGHGRKERGLDSVARQEKAFGRFGRMFPDLAAAKYGDKIEDAQKLMIAIGETMIQVGKPPANIVTAEVDDENPDIPSGYTYFGQFVDHDITFDPVSDLDRENDPGGLEDFRTARLDLDSVYGSGPDDQPYLYNPDLTFKMGANKAPDYLKALKPKEIVRRDVQRATFDGDTLTPPDDTTCRRAIIGDPRNDENNIVVQIHSLWQRFHNRIMADLAKGDRSDPANVRPRLTGKPAFDAAQRIERWHYQWVVIHDFLRRIVGQKTFDAVFNNGTPNIQFYKPENAQFPFMPVEFSVAAYRCGHSMVRPSYSLSARIPHTITNKLDRIAIFSTDRKCGSVASLNGFRPLVDEWGIDWHFFLDVVSAHMPKDTKALKFSDFKVPQPSYRIDTLLVDPLAHLPDHLDLPKPKHSLANLNLLRGVALGLPSGQAVARHMQLGDPVLTDDQLWKQPGNLTDATAVAARAKVFDDNAALLHENAPLWYYILREAELTDVREETDGKDVLHLGGRHLGPVGGCIVAEVIIGLIAQDSQSYLNQNPGWQPTIPTAGGSPATLKLGDIVNYVDS
jgi:hypothetical protein